VYYCGFGAMINNVTHAIFDEEQEERFRFYNLQRKLNSFKDENVFIIWVMDSDRPKVKPL
jgi:hypothetical protein